MSCIDMINQSLVQLLHDVENMECYHRIGCYLYQVKDYRNAENYLKLCYDNAPQTEYIGHDYGLVLYTMGKYEQALEVYKKEWDIATDNMKVAEKLEELYYCLGRYEEFFEMKEVCSHGKQPKET